MTPYEKPPMTSSSTQADTDAGADAGTDTRTTAPATALTRQDDSSAPAQPTGTQTLMRGLAVIEAVAAGARDLKAIGKRIGTTRSTTHRLVSCLLAERYLRLSVNGYYLGAKLVELGYHAREQIPLATLARPHLDQLASFTGDTLHLAVRDGDEVLYLDKIAGRQGLEMRSRVGQRMPLALTGVGKALLLDSPREEWSRLFSLHAAVPRGSQGAHASSPGSPHGGGGRHGGAPVIRHQRPDPEALSARMQQYAEAGYAFDLEDNEPSIRCVAAPIRDASRMIVAAISVSSTVPYMSLERMDDLIPIVMQTARDISGELGFPA
jgi:DNA-binding IclR family transcriptional regulator